MATKSVKISTVPKPAQPAAKKSAQTLVGWLFPLYLIAIFLGYALLRLPAAMTAGQEMGPTRAFFSAVNAGTLTGFPQTTDIDKYRALGQATVFGLIVCGSLLSLIIGGLAVTRILQLGYSDLQVISAAFIAEAAAIGLGTFLLLFDRDRTVVQAIFLSASAFGNSGLVLGPTPSPGNWQTHLILLPLITLGGLGLCVLMELFSFFHGRIARLSDHARVTLLSTAWIYVAGTLLLITLGLWADPTIRGSALRDLVASSAAAAVSSRTAGMGLTAISQLSRPAVWVVMLFMCIGASSAGTAGGIKTTTLVQLYRGIRRALTGQTVSRAFGIAAVWVAGYFLLILLALLSLLQHLPQMAADRVLFTVISAASNVGLTDEPLNPDRPAAFILCAVMLSGRLLPMIVLWWMADTCIYTDLAAG